MGGGRDRVHRHRGRDGPERYRPERQEGVHAGTGADWLTRAYDDMKAMGGIALTYFNVSAATNNEPADWTWPLNPTKTTTYTRGSSDRHTITTTVAHLTDRSGRRRHQRLTWPRPPGPHLHRAARRGRCSPTTSTTFTDTPPDPYTTHPPPPPPPPQHPHPHHPATTPSRRPVWWRPPPTPAPWTDTPTPGHTYTVCTPHRGRTASTTSRRATPTYSYTMTASNTTGPPPPSPQQHPATTPPASFHAHGRRRVTVPGLVQPGDTMVLFVSTNTGIAPSATASGWTRVGARTLSDLGTEMWTRTAGADEAGRAVTVSLPSISKFDLTLLAYSGASPSQPALRSRQ